MEHNALKYGVDITRGSKRIFGVSDDEQGTTRLSETLYLVADAWNQPEMLFPIGILIWAVNPSSGASVGNFSQVGISNPAGSGQMVVVEAFEANSAANGNWELRIGANVAFTATATPTQRDTRIGGLPNSNLATVSLSNQAAARIGTLLTTSKLSGNIWNLYQHPVVLSPGFFCAIGTDATNVASAGNFWGYEYKANPGELLSI